MFFTTDMKNSFFCVSKMWPWQIGTVVLLFSSFFYYLIGPNLSNCPQQSRTMFLQQAWKRRCLSYHWDVLLKVSTCDWESRKYYSHVISIIDCKTEAVLLLSCYHGSRWWTSKRRQWVIKRCETISCSHCCSQGNRQCRHSIWARIYFFNNTGFSSGSQSPDTCLLGSPLASEKLIPPCVCLKFARHKTAAIRTEVCWCCNVA